MTKKDFTVYYPLYDGRRYNTTPYSFNRMVDAAFNTPEDILNFLKECYLTKEECDERCITLNALKPTVITAANKYVGHPKEIDEDLSISMQRDGFIDGAYWAIENFNIK